MPSSFLSRAMLSGMSTFCQISLVVFWSSYNDSEKAALILYACGVRHTWAELLLIACKVPLPVSLNFKSSQSLFFFLHVTVRLVLWFVLHYCWREGSLSTESPPSPPCSGLLVHQTWDLSENTGGASSKWIWLSFPWDRGREGGREGARLYVCILFLPPLSEWGVWTRLRHGPGPGSWSHNIACCYLGSHLWVDTTWY